MHSIQELQELVNQAIAEKKFAEDPKELYEPINYLMDLSGKRMRPVLLLMASDIFHGNIHKSLDPAIGIEVFHNFTLVHDDIMDKAPLRRGFPTVHEKWNENIAILAGDVMLVESFKLMMNVEANFLRPVLNIFNDVAAGVCRGQQLDMNFEGSSTVELSAYLEMIRLKTAILLGGSLKIGAILGGASLFDSEKLYQFGTDLGVAFQLQDDILDVYGDPGKFGKQIGGDILSNKKTFLLIKALELAEGIDAKELDFWLYTNNTEPNAKVKAVTAIYNRLDVRKLAEEEMSTFAKKAIQSLEQVAAQQERKKPLFDFAAALLVREN